MQNYFFILDTNAPHTKSRHEANPPKLITIVNFLRHSIPQNLRLLSSSSSGVGRNCNITTLWLEGWLDVGCGCSCCIRVHGW